MSENNTTNEENSLPIDTQEHKNVTPTEAPTQSEKDNNHEKKKKPKKKGPIRTEAIIPSLIFFALVFSYFKFFFDSHLKSALEWTGTQIHGAEVNISKIDSSVAKAYFHVYGLQVTNKEKPTHNLIEIEKIKFELLWDGLLRAKFVVNESSVENIRISSLRKKPGFVIPPDESLKENKALKEVEKNVLSQAQSDFDQNILGDIAHVLGGTNEQDQINKIKAELTSEKKIKEIQSLLDEKKKIWNQRLKELPDQKYINQVSKEIKTLKFDTKNPQAFANDLSKLDQIIKAADKKIKTVNEASSGLNTDMNLLNASLKEIEKHINNDIKDLQKRLKIPSINTKDFSKKLFGRMFQEKIAGYSKYIELAKDYMPPKKTAEEKAPSVIPKKRGAGKNYRFPKKKGYPLVWVKKTVISSQSDNSEFGGDLKGEITDITSSPSVLGRPTVIQFSGDFPQQNVSGIQAKISLDHTKNVSNDTFYMNIKSFPVDEKKLSSSSDVKFSMKKAFGSSEIRGIVKDDQLNILSKNKFTKIDYLIESKNKDIKEVLMNVVNDIPVVTVNSAAKGTWSNIKWSINSNLGDELSKGFKAQIQNKINEARKKINAFVNNKIKVEKDKLLGDFNSIKAQVDSKVKDAQAKVNTTKNQAQKELNQKKNAAKIEADKKIKKEGQKLLKDLKKKFGL